MLCVSADQQEQECRSIPGWGSASNSFYCPSCHLSAWQCTAWCCRAVHNASGMWKHPGFPVTTLIWWAVSMLLGMSVNCTQLVKELATFHRSLWNAISHAVQYETEIHCFTCFRNGKHTWCHCTGIIVLLQKSSCIQIEPSEWNKWIKHYTLSMFSNKWNTKWPI